MFRSAVIFLNIIHFLTLCGLITKVAAKTRIYKEVVTTRSLKRTDQIKQLEARLTPYCRYRIKHRTKNIHPTDTIPRLEESDLFMLAKVWNSLSPTFKELYLESIKLPDDFLSYVTPGGHFEIYYTTTGPSTDDMTSPNSIIQSFQSDSVDITDEYGFSSEDWREKTTGPNGIPDYIDETAYALDSTWSMEIERFGFISPFPYKDTHYTSNRYKVIVEHQDDTYYGITYLYQKEGQKGFSSYISLRHNWNSEEWIGTGYDIHPINGVRVTCAHEFFHAIQYSMCWNVVDGIWLDDFPLSWIEGSAVSMEELAFDSINDYHQYAESYFYDPTMSFFNLTQSERVYSHVLLFLYIFKHNEEKPGINFIKEMLFSNYDTQQLPFSDNLLHAGALYESSWEKKLHGFHTASLFTGKHADTSLFLSDAPYFPELRIANIKNNDTFAETLPLNSGYFLRIPHEKTHNDTITFSITGSVLDSTDYQTPVYSFHLKRQQKDSLIAISADSDGDVLVRLTPWTSGDTCIFIATNAHPSKSQSFTLSVQPFPVTYPKGTKLFDTLPDIQTKSIALFSMEAYDDLRSDYSFSISDEIPTGKTEDNRTVEVISSCINLSTPSSWPSAASLTLSLQTDLQSIVSDSVFLAFWNKKLLQWTLLNAIHADTTGTIKITTQVNSSGIYALVQSEGIIAHSGNKCYIYPNPMSHRRHHSILYCNADDITDISIYSCNGDKVYHYSSTGSSSKNNQAIKVQCRNQKIWVPGIYFVLIEQFNSENVTSRQSRHKVMITP